MFQRVSVDFAVPTCGNFGTFQQLSCTVARTLLIIIFCAICQTGFSDRLFHQDGTVISGKITFEDPDVVKIETKYGNLSYEKLKLTNIERDADIEAQKQKMLKATPVNYSHLIPAGPINPMAPPPPAVNLVRAALAASMAVQTTDTAAQSSETATATLPPPATAAPVPTPAP